MKDKIPNVKRYSYLANEMEALYHEASLKCGISDSAMKILYAVCMYGEECPVSEIVRTSGISKQTINSSLRKLESDGILYLKSAGGKKKTAILTDKGKELSERSAMKVLNTEIEILNSWTPEEKAAYITLTEKFLNDFREKVKEF